MIASCKKIGLDIVHNVFSQQKEKSTPMDQLDVVQLSILGAILTHIEDIQNPSAKFAREEWTSVLRPDDAKEKWMRGYSWSTEKKQAMITIHNLDEEYLEFQWSEEWWHDLAAIVPSLQWLGFHVYDYKNHAEASQFIDLLVSWEELDGYPLDFGDTSDEDEEDRAPIEHIHYPAQTYYQSRLAANRDERALATILGKKNFPSLMFNSPTDGTQLRELARVLFYVQIVQESPEEFDIYESHWICSSLPDDRLMSYLRYRQVDVYLKDGRVMLSEQKPRNTAKKQRIE